MMLTGLELLLLEISGELSKKVKIKIASDLQ